MECVAEWMMIMVMIPTLVYQTLRKGKDDDDDDDDDDTTFGLSNLTKR
jgi:hypothetical protein